MHIPLLCLLPALAAPGTGTLTGLGRSPQGKRLENWNQLVTEHLREIDAFTYHIYVKKGISAAKRIEQQMIQKEDIEIWITEYGIQIPDKLGKTEQEECIQQRDDLRQYVEASSQIALCHILTTQNTAPKSDNFSAIRFGGDTLNPVGVYFKERADKKGPKK